MGVCATRRRHGKKEFRAIELSCWGCWLNNTGAAARQRGLAVDLIGIEGDEEHVKFALESLTVNGFSRDEFQIVHGVAAPRQSKALFPVVINAGANCGSAPVFDATEIQIKEAGRTGRYQVLDAWPLADLSSGKPIDLLHIDIQEARQTS